MRVTRRQWELLQIGMLLLTQQSTIDAWDTDEDGPPPTQDEVDGLMSILGDNVRPDSRAKPPPFKFST